MTQGYPLDQLLSLRLLKPLCDNVLLEHGGLAHVIPLTVLGLVNSLSFSNTDPLLLLKLTI